MFIVFTGVTNQFATWSWYRTSFEVPSSWERDNRVLLNFGAVDYEATVYVNGDQVGNNTGGYWSFTIDITSALQNGTNEL
jgi:beta-galactosidase/beta-glucuronidase